MQSGRAASTTGTDSAETTETTGTQGAIQRRRGLVVTTINAPNACLRALADGAGRHGLPFIVAGDTKSPPDFALSPCDYYSIERQVGEFPELSALLPTRHYVRKNVAYLAAMRLGVGEIQETDDDNFPAETFWSTTISGPSSAPSASGMDAFMPDAVAAAKGHWLNVYRLFTDQFIWPRGLPLEFIHGSEAAVSQGPRASAGLILQGLADDNPDVDAVFRLTRPLPVRFDHRPPVWLAPGTWCPFNSQNTLFRREVFPLLYLPSRCSFRMTDIWRSFVAQRCLWELGEGVVFHAPTVHQERNEHNLLRDFEDEIPGYRLNEKIRQTLEPLSLGTDLLANLVRCYQALIDAGHLPGDEMPILRAWCREVERLA